MSRGRRLIALVGLALLAVGGADRPGRAQTASPPAEDVPGAPAPIPSDDIPGAPPATAPGGMVELPPTDPEPLDVGGFVGLPEPMAPPPPGAPTAPEVPPGGPEDLFTEGVAPNLGFDLPAEESGASTSPTPPAQPSGGDDPPHDPEVMPAQTPPDEEATAPEAPAPPAAASTVTPAGSAFLVSPDRLREGAQDVGVSVQVVAPPTMNLNKPARVAIVVKNTGASEALGVIVRDQLPPGSQFVEAQPAPEGDTSAGLLVWSLGDLPPGVERRLDLTVTPTAIGNQDHAATVHFLSGSRARTLVQEPKLRVEQTVSRTQVLRGEQVQFDILVTNTGTGPARDVLLRAELSDGLTHPSEGRVLELKLASTEINGQRRDQLRPGESIRLPALIVDTLGGGEQTCTVSVTSPDVVEAPEAASVKAVTVVEPKLKVAVEGPPTRYTEFDADYTITVTNPGTAPARTVRVTATLDGDARPYQPARGGVWDASRRAITWDLPQLAVGESQTFPLRVRLGSVGHFQVNAEAVGSGRDLKDHASVSTSVEGNAYLELIVTEEMRLLDVGQKPVFTIKIRNIGTKEARDIKVKAELSDTLKAVETAGTEEVAVVENATNTVVFPSIPHLPAGKEMTLQIKAEAVKGGLATCRAFLTHQDIQYEVEDVANATVIESPRR